MVTEILYQAEKTIQHTPSITIDWNEVCLLVIGAGIGLIVSCITMVAQRFVDRSGSLRIFYKIINDKGKATCGWGFLRNTENRLYLSIPVVFELQNTSNIMRVFRDLSLLLYQDDLLTAKMVQVSHMQVTTEKGTAVIKETECHFGGEKDTYSFALEPCSIQKQECQYVYLVKEGDVFNKIVARYYDEKNRPHYFFVRDINSTEEKRFEPDKDWILLNDSRICRKLK